MRVLFNAFASYRVRTGVGSYAANLLTALNDHAGSQVQAFPGGWLTQLTAVGLSLIARRGAKVPSAPSHLLPNSARRIRGAATRLVWRTAMRFYERRLHQAVSRGQINLYHEPNFIPWPCDVPAIATVHDLSALLHPEWHPAERAVMHQRRLESGVAGCAHVLTDTECVRQELIRYFGLPPKKITAVHLGIRTDLRPMTPAETAPTRARLRLPSSYFLHVGSIEPRKNLLMLIRTYCSLPAYLRVRCPLVLVGPWGWHYDDIRTYLESTARHRGVIRLGYVSDADLPAVYASARALLYPSFYEGFGLPPLEMMAAGGPVMASTAGAICVVCGGMDKLF